MRLFLSVSDRIGFAALCISGALAASVSSLLRLILRYLLRLYLGAMKKARNPFAFNRLEKNGTKWYRLKIGSYSFMIGKGK